MPHPSLAGFLAVVLVVSQAHAQDRADTAPHFIASFRVAPLEPPPNAALAPGGRLGPRTSSALVADRWEDGVRAQLPHGFVPDLTVLAAKPAGDSLALPSLPTAPPPEMPRQTGLLGPYADLGMQLNLRFELKADQFRNLACTPLDQLQAFSGCNPGFPTITPTPQYQVRTAGTIAQRLHVNVDFDSQREFDANNNLQIWYEGLEDEVLRRVEAGNVTFQMPRSRFITAGIPANNFGIQAISQFGPLEVRGIYAQQKGNIIQDRTYTVGETTTQPADRLARDLDYEQGRFFFAVDPVALPSYPAVDVLNIDAATLPLTLRVGGLHVYRLRAVSPTSTNQQNVGGVRAVACGVGAVVAVDCSVQRAGPFQWEVLQEGKDYYVDPSGAWFVLASRLDQNDYLAVSYIPVGQTACGPGSQCVGTFPVNANPNPSVIDTLRIVYDPRPGVAATASSFRFELRNAYRVGGGEITRETVQLALTLNQRERSLASDQTYLARLGLAIPSEQTRFDQYNRLFPRTRDPQQGGPVHDFFIVFPHITPFADSSKLTPPERNDSLYRTPRTLLATQAPPAVFQMQLHANVSLAGDRASLSLNSFQIRDGSEKIYVGGTLLTRGTDYAIDYASGTVQFTNPDSLFGAGATQVRAQFEERAAFAVAPTSIFGVAAHYDLGDRGELNVTGLYQNQQSAFTRPPLGLEPSSAFIGGVSTELHFRPEWVTQALNIIPGIHTDAPSFLNVSAEVARSQPSPNPLGQATVEDFEADAGRFLSLGENTWHWGSVPATTRGAEPYGFSSVDFDSTHAAALTWQSLPYNQNGNPVQFLPQQIDPTIVTVGQGQSAEPALWLMLKPDTVLGLASSKTGLPNWTRPHVDGPRWRSITQSLSATGIDLSRVEYLELWVWEDSHRTAMADHTALLLDFGSVFEDAMAFVPDTFTVSASGDTTYQGYHRTGLGKLDTEADPLTHSWSAAINDEGILSDRVTDGIWDRAKGVVRDTLPLCALMINGAQPHYGFGDLRSRCGRHNGSIDTEDLDGDFQLDSAAGARRAESFVRYVFEIGDPRYYVRDGGMVAVKDTLGNPDGMAGWRLYRIPFHTDTILQGAPSLQQIQSVRITMVTPQTAPLGAPDPQVFFGLARVRLVGATWLKRTDSPARGIAGSQGTGIGEVIASVVSTENQDLGYIPPPGLSNEAARIDAGVQLGTTQVNERSLRLLATGLDRGQHAEAYTHFTTTGDKNFLKYQRLRAWARGRGAGWDTGDLEFYIKAGKDQANFYFYHTTASTTTWDPEVVVDFSRWLTLRSHIELAWLQGQPPHVFAGCPDSTLVPFDTSYIACDGPYIVHVHDPATAPPNLAAVEEIAAGIWRVGTKSMIDQAELWVDDVRLSDVVRDPGMAAGMDLTFTAANVADMAVSFTHRDGQFRQLGADPSYTTDNGLSIGATVQLQRFLPESWGLSMPFTVHYAHLTSDPFYLSGTDIEAGQLAGLRTPRSEARSYAIGLRHTRRSNSKLMRYLIDPIGLSGAYANGTGETDLSLSAAKNFTLNADYSLSPAPARVGGIRVSPTNIRLHSGLAGLDGSRFSYTVPVARDSDGFLVPAYSRSKVWRNAGGFDLAPLTGVLFRIDLASQRDLHDYGDSSTMGRLVQGERRSFLGMNAGLETQRTLNTFLSVTPRINTWLRPRLGLASFFTLSRDPNAATPVRGLGGVDTVGAFHIPAAYSNSRRLDLGTQLDPHRLGQRIFGDSAVLAYLLGRITTVDVEYGRTYTSTYFGAPLIPPLGYQFALGGFDGFRHQGSLLAGSATDNMTLNSAATVELIRGFRVTGNYARLNGTSWVLRGNTQVPLTTTSREWPSFNASWVLTLPGTRDVLLLHGLTARLGYRKRNTTAQQILFGDVAGGSTLSLTNERTLAPAITLNWVGGVVTSYDISKTTSDAVTSNNLFRTTRNQQSGSLLFAFRPPSALVRLRSVIRTTVRYTSSQDQLCLQAPDQDTCVSYVDTRQSQTQLTLDTDFPPSLSAGLQMAYVINDQRQFNHKTAQLVVTAFVNMSTSVGRIR
ncbi:MAG TPA: cell surface protein SprA [Gemmatimonadales bacterium]|nr:cell surface protein SprA [Gemmatimonadales bacterium]